MKKALFFPVFIILSANLWALNLSMSAGAGGLMGGLFTRYNLKADGIKDGNEIKIDAGQEMNQFNYGGLLFFDAAYGELSVFIQRGLNNWKQILDISGIENNEPSTGKGWETMFGITLLGKYPFRMGERLSIFPLLGMEYQITLVQERTQPDGWIYDRSDGIREKDKDGDAYKLSDWNSFFVNIGGGADFFISESIFIRGEFLYSIRLKTSYEKKNIEYMKAMSGDNDPKLTGLTSGPSLRLSAGYRFL